MGVERSVSRWYIQQQTILYEITALETKIAQLQHHDDAEAEPVFSEDEPSVELAELLQQLALSREKLKILGPCPKPMMG
jgi:hypothetical protein